MKAGEKKNAVVVLSGGQDSATALALAVRKHGADNVAAITFSYGQRHSIEVRYARRLAIERKGEAGWKQDLKRNLRS